MAISGHQRLSVAISGNQRTHSVAISGHQRLSVVISGNQRTHRGIGRVGHIKPERRIGHIDRRRVGWH